MCLALVALAALAVPAAAIADPHGAYTSSTEKCESCHVPHTAAGDSILASSTVSSLCYICHDGSASMYDTAREFGGGEPSVVSSHPVGSGAIASCASCHTAHEGPSEGNTMALAAGPGKASQGNAVCGACHGSGSALPPGDKMSGFAGSAHATRVPLPASGTGIACLACHEPHGSSNPWLIARQVKGMSGATNTVSITATSGSTPACVGCHDADSGTFGGARPFGITKHATVTTSTLSSVTWPGLPGATAGQCSNCHDAHGTGNPDMLRASGEDLCLRCHDAAGTSKPAGYSYQGGSTYAAGPHASISSTGGLGYRRLDAGTSGFAAYESTAAGSPGSPGTAMSSAKAARLASSDSSYAVTALANATGQYDTQIYRFRSPAAGTDISTMRVLWRGYGEDIASYETTLSIWNATTSAWDAVSGGIFGSPTLVAKSVSAPSKYVDGDGYIWVRARAEKVVQSQISAGPTLSNITSATATVEWTTLGLSDSRVEYGTGTSGPYSMTATSGALVSNHSITIPLAGQGFYHYRVVSTSRAGESATSTDRSFFNVRPTVVPLADQAGYTRWYSATGQWTADGAIGGPYEYRVHAWSPVGFQDVYSSWQTSTTFTWSPWTWDYSSAPHYWQVQVRSAGGVEGPWSDIDSFTVTDLTSPPISCPFVYTWDGSKFIFEADVNVGGNLLKVPWVRPTTQDYLRMRTAPVEKDGALEYHVVEERQEIDYTDEYALYAVDVAGDRDVYPEKPKPGGATGDRLATVLHTVAKDPLRPLSAVHVQTGEDVSGLIADSDGRYLSFNPDRNADFTWQTVELDLGDVRDAPQVKLVLDVMSYFANSAEGLAKEATLGSTRTRIEVRDDSGAWVSVPTTVTALPRSTEFSRPFVLDISRIWRSDSRRVRLSWRQKTVIDSLRVDTTADEPVTVTKVPLLSAELRARGFDPRSSEGDVYEYLYGDPSGRSWYLSGYYTRFGDVTPLLRGTDDKFVVAGGGDETVLRFAVPEPAEAGLTRRFIVYANGYYKPDRPPAPATVEPLPFAGMSTYPYGPTEQYPDDPDHAAYRAEYNTRYEAPASAEYDSLAMLARAGDPFASYAMVVVGAADRAASLSAVPDTLHRSLNTDEVAVEVSVAGGGGGATSCGACHAVHGAGIGLWDGTRPVGSLTAPSARLCTGDGTGGCHSAASNSAGGVNILARLTASTNALTHHDLTEDAQRTTGARLGCQDCHDPHTESVAARYSDPTTISVPVAFNSGPYADASGTVWVLIGAKHDGTAPSISATAVAGRTSASTVLTPTISWTTNEPATSWIDWGTSPSSLIWSAGNVTLTTVHSVQLSGLAQDTVYYWRIRTTDAVGNTATSTVSSYDTSIPIWQMSSPLLTTRISFYLTPYVTWTSTDYTSGKVEWATTPGGPYTSSATSSSLTQSHNVTFSRLDTGTVYYWRATGVDALGRSVYSAESSYTAEAATPTITSGPVASSARGSEQTVTVSWLTSDYTSSYVAWDTVSHASFDDYVSSNGSGAEVTTHTAYATGLTVGTMYYLRVRGYDPLGRAVTSDEITFTPRPYPSKPVASAPANTGVDTWVGWSSTSVPTSWTVSSGDGDPIEYQPWIVGAGNTGGSWPAGVSWSSVTTWATMPLSTWEHGYTNYTFYVTARDTVHPWLTTPSDPITIRITDYPSGSCPFLFTWDGERFAFDADVSTGGKLGKGEPAGQLPPTPQDYLRLRNAPVSKDGSLEFRLVEERYEVDYTDQMALYAADVPYNRDVYPEKPRRGGPLEDGFGTALHTVSKHMRGPVSAVHVQTGEDVTGLLAASDGRRVQLNEDRNRDIAYQTLELDLGRIQAAEQTKLVIDAVSMYPTTPVGQAIMNRFPGTSTKLEVQDASGQWALVPLRVCQLPRPPEFTRPFVLDVSNIWLSDSRRVRLTFSLKTYVDSVRIDVSKDEPVRLTKVPLRSAELRPRGIDEMSSPDDIYQYVYGSPTGRFRYLPGSYTRYGDVTPLLDRTDDKFVVYGGGDELALRFEDPGDAPTDMTRRYFMYANGYYKDAKTDMPLEVGPLPSAAMSTYPYRDGEHYPDDADHDEYQATWNTRTVSGQVVTDAMAVVARATEWLDYAGLVSSPTQTVVPTAVTIPRPPAHYSANTDIAQLQFKRVNDTLASVGMSAAYGSAGSVSSTPTPSAPGTPIIWSDVSKAASRDSQYMVTDMATGEGDYNWQALRFDIPGFANGVESFRMRWVGYGEPTAGHPVTVSIWNRQTARWDAIWSGQAGTDAEVWREAETTSSSMCLKCHSGSVPAGVVMRPGVANVGPSWNTPSGDLHGGGAGYGFSGGLAPGLSRGQAAISCYTCHDPHGSSNIYHVPSTVNGQTGVTASTGPELRNLCGSCHAGVVQNWHQACQDCHVWAEWEGGHTSPNINTWITNASDCSACHGHGRSWTHSKCSDCSDHSTGEDPVFPKTF